jgi:tetraacyldisaccharide 4'-kinase
MNIRDPAMTEMKKGMHRQLADMLNPYSWITAARNRLFDTGVIKSHEPEVATICIGNISVGGTGKTPHTEYLARLLKERFKTAVLSRGYGRKSKGYILADGSSTAAAIGDEPFQIKNKFNDIDVAVCERRAEGIERLTADIKGIDVVLLDDAYQHRHIKAGLNILLIDSSRPIWQDAILPFGRLRESARGISRADIVIMTKCGEMTPELQRELSAYIKNMKELPVFFSRMRYGELYPLFNNAGRSIDEETDILLVTGIARPAPLKEEIESTGARVTLMQYADHHDFTDGDIREIAKRYRNIGNGKKMIVTTEKDATRIAGHKEIPTDIKESIHVMPIEVEFMNNGKEMFNQIIMNYVTENSRNS